MQFIYLITYVNDSNTKNLAVHKLSRFSHVSSHCAIVY